MAVAKTGVEAAASPLYARALPVAAALLASAQAAQVLAAQAAFRVVAAEVAVSPVAAQVFRQVYLSLPAHVFQDA